MIILNIISSEAPQNPFKSFKSLIFHFSPFTYLVALGSK